ncbi:hypothetical protein ACFOSC_09205 [Streptantibioticus rubrisoli]|uniref:Uncharacterized protein n=1 Tax=Streptantibioticus rubrisoli TaxID=1387313 RepID=A0ABT1P9G3_9ACTN|nr:hypothetical protein [Streptantibioticus rubrisoli]MCQ4040888.1 hypothetical protein [Streptantibioticus rubrisoli]
MGRVEQYGRMGSALRGGYTAPWQQKVMWAFVVGAAAVILVSVLLVAFG